MDMQQGNMHANLVMTHNLWEFYVHRELSLLASPYLRSLLPFMNGGGRSAATFVRNPRRDGVAGATKRPNYVKLYAPRRQCAAHKVFV